MPRRTRLTRGDGGSTRRNVRRRLNAPKADIVQMSVPTPKKIVLKKTAIQVVGIVKPGAKFTREQAQRFIDEARRATGTKQRPHKPKK